MKKRKSMHSTIYILLVLYLTVMISTIRHADTFSALIEEALTNGQFFTVAETYLQEHLGFHDQLFQVKSQFDLLVGEKMIQGIYVTDDGLMEKFTEDTTDIASAEPLNLFYETTQIPTYFVLVPSAAAIYESSLPANALTINQDKRIKFIYQTTDTNIRCIDAYQILTSLKDNYIYYRTDTHWTCYGAYYIYQTLIQKMGFMPVSYQRYVISHLRTDFRGNLYQKTLYSNVKPDILDCYYYETGCQILQIQAYYQDGSVEERTELYDSSALDSDNMYQFYAGAPCEKLIIKTDLDNHKKLLLYKDDFADCMIPFLIQHYNEICVINLEQTGMHFQDIVDTTDYTQALFLCSLQNWQSWQ